MDVLAFAVGMRAALYQCGQVGRALQGRVAREEKAPDSVHQMSTSVSVVDRLCQEILLLRAYALAPYLEVQSEEMEDCPPAIRDLFAGNAHRYVLVMDPVDGTGDFLDGADTYAHMMGLLDQESGRMDLGMIYFPEGGRLYVGVRDMGAFVSEGFYAPLEPMDPVSPPRTVERVKRLKDADYAAFRELGFRVVPAESGSAAYELTRVAEGVLGAMVMRHFHGHDTAISSVIIEELGGQVCGVDGCTVTYEKEMPRMPLVISSLVPDYARRLAEGLGDDRS
ncbi:MAG: inositol monophosphatase family protein [Anaerolineae bacterium]